MRPPKLPASHSLFKPSRAASSARKQYNQSSLATLVSYFHSSPTQPPPKRHLSSTQVPSFSSRNPQNNEFISIHSPDTSKLPKDTVKTASCHLIPSPEPQNNEFGTKHLPNSSNQPKPIINTNLRATISSPKHQNNEPLFNIHSLLDSNKNIIKTIFCDPMLPKFTQTRSFSAAPSDQFPKPLDSMEPGSSNSVPAVSTVASPSESYQSIDAGSSIRKPISLWPGMYHSPVTNALWEARSSIFERLSNVPNDAPPQSDLITKTPSQSRTSILYKFSSDYILREQYRNPWNEIRMGKLLEDLDALAGTISFKHCSSDNRTTRPLLLVTASVDKMVLKKPIQVDTDLKIVGAVTWVGRSSMEIQLEVTQSTKETSNSSDSQALIANFTFVARDCETGKPALVNQILPETEEEKLLWKEADERNKMRKRKRGEHKKEFENGETDRLKELLAEGRIFCDMPALANRDSILMQDTCLQNSLICQPQQRNIHGRIFGGFLMRRAFELAFATAYAFAGSAPLFLEVDHVDFVRPVDVGNFLRLKSCVLYAELENPVKPLINVEVVAHVTQPELRASEVSNKFYFTFTVRSEAMRKGLRIRNVVPATEEEARRVIERMDAESS